MKLKEALEKNSFVITSELKAFIDEEPGKLIKSLKLVQGRINGVSISELELEGIVEKTIKTCELLKKNQFEAIYQTPTRKKNRLQLQKDLILVYQAGVDNLLVFTEDYRITGDSLQEMMFFHVDSGKLASVLEHIREGQTVDGEKLPFKVEFLLGSGVESAWGENILELEMKEMEEMTEMGTGYFLTTPVFDLALFKKFMKRVEIFSIPVIAEVMILRTAGMAQFLNRHFRSGLVPEWIIKRLARASDKQKASIEIFAHIVEGLRDLCQGVHIITEGNDNKLGYYLDAAKLN